MNASRASDTRGFGTGNPNGLTAYPDRACRTCGSPIIKRIQANPDFVRLRLGTLDVDPGVVAESHIMVSSKAAWVKIHDDLPQLG